MTTSEFPLISHAQVSGIDPVTGYIQVTFPSLMGAAFNVRPLHHGPADGLRIKQSPMPTIGTWGLVCCPYGDSRNAIWLGAIYTSGIDAKTGDGDPYVDYHSHWSGAFTHMDSSGDYYQYFPDGTYIAAATSTSLPAVTRHIVNSAQQRVTTSFPASGRTASAVAPRPFLIHHGSGTTVNITAAGSVSTTAVAGQTISLIANGTTFIVDAAGNVNIMLASGAKFNLSDGGGTSDFLVLAQSLVAAFNSHTHTGVTTGGGNTGAPAVALTPAGISSSLISVQS
jgi:phage baseplate assembly protein gpV